VLGDVVEHRLDEVRVFFNVTKHMVAAAAQHSTQLSGFVAVVEVRVRSFSQFFSHNQASDMFRRQAFRQAFHL